MIITLNAISPWDKHKPYKEQQAFLTLDRRVQNGRKSRNHWIGGRGSGKTLTCVLLALKAALELCPGLPGMVTEPSGRKIRDIFLPLWQAVVPANLYTYYAGEQKIVLTNGSVIYLRSRHVDSPANAMLKGMNVAWDIDDEMAEKCVARIFDDIDAAIRVKSPYSFHDTASTPIMNDYHDIVFREGHTRLFTSSKCNPHLPENWVDDIAGYLSPQYKAREIDGQFVPLAGLMWPEWSNADWPKGNMHPHAHEHGKPYWLAFDIGVASSAWLIIQPIEHALVVTAEYMPMREGSIDTIASKIAHDYGAPSAVIVGADINTRASTDAETGAFIVRRIFGGVPIHTVSGHHANKEIQHMQLSFGICSAKGQRRFCVSKQLRSVPPRKDHNRGILEVMTQDSWPDNSAHRNVWDAVKEHRLEHARDAAMYFATFAWPPHFTRMNRAA